MKLLDRLGDRERKLLLIGVPIAAGAAALSILRGRTTQAEEEPATTGVSAGGTIPSAFAGSDAVIGVGQLAEFESIISASINNMWLKQQETNETLTDLAARLAEANTAPQPTTPDNTQATPIPEWMTRPPAWLQPPPATPQPPPPQPPPPKTTMTDAQLLAGVTNANLRGIRERQLANPEHRDWALAQLRK